MQKSRRLSGTIQIAECVTNLKLTQLCVLVTPLQLLAPTSMKYSDEYSTGHADVLRVIDALVKITNGVK